MSAFERITELTEAHDGRSKKCGIQSVDFRMIVKNEKGAVQFAMCTGWNLKHVREEGVSSKPYPYDLGYHSPKPQYDAQIIIDENCPYIDGPCYYDGSGLNADPIFDLLCEKGGEAVWQELEKYHNQIFSKEKDDESHETNSK